MRFATTFAALVGAACLMSCTDPETSIMALQDAPAFSAIPAPAGLVTIPIGTNEIAIHPYTTSSIEQPSDPVNLIFTGQVDPRALRAALMGLDGNRTAFDMPDVYPFNCTWTDAHGEMQAVYTDQAGWTGNVVQLACGNYGPVRFHLRLFPAGQYTIGGAHFELLIPNTADHQVLNWELAKQLVVVDFGRTGLLGAQPTATATIHAAPFRTIPAFLYNELPADLQFLVSGQAGDASDDVGIVTDGTATILILAGAAQLVPGTTSETLTLEYATPAPRPFCSQGPLDWVYIAGPVTVSRSATQSPDGTMQSEVVSQGELTITPINPVTGEPTGASSTALINEISHAVISDTGHQVNAKSIRKEIGVNGQDRVGLEVRMQLGDPGREFFARDEFCGK